MIEYLYVLFRIIARPFANVYQKKLTHNEVEPIFIVCSTELIIFVVMIPLILLFPIIKISSIFLVSIFAAAFFNAIGNIFQLKSLKITELSVFGPISSYRPIFAMIISYFLINEVPSYLGIIGMVIIFFGSYLINLNKSQNNFIPMIKSKGFRYRFLAMILFSFGAVFLKQAIVNSNPISSLFFLSLSSFLITAIILLVRKKHSIVNNLKLIQTNKLNYSKVIISVLAMEVFTLLTFSKMYVGYSLALFQLSSVISVGFGYHYFKEKNILPKLIGAFVMIIGVLVIVLA